MTQVNFNDFYQVPGLKFDIHKLKDDLKKVLKKKILIALVYHILEQFL